MTTSYLLLQSSKTIERTKKNSNGFKKIIKQQKFHCTYMNINMVLIYFRIALLYVIINQKKSHFPNFMQHIPVLFGGGMYYGEKKVVARYSFHILF